MMLVKDKGLIFFPSQRESCVKSKPGVKPKLSCQKLGAGLPEGHVTFSKGVDEEHPLGKAPPPISEPQDRPDGVQGTRPGDKLSISCLNSFTGINDQMYTSKQKLSRIPI